MTGRNRKSSTGFTLLEVMVALSIFALCAFTLLKQSGLSTRQLQLLESRMQATWIAENNLAKVRLQRPWPPQGHHTETQRQGQREWEIETSISTTSNKHLRRVEVNVKQADRTLARLTGFIGEY